MIGNKTIVGLVITTMVLSCVAVAVTADEGRVEPMGLAPGSITAAEIAADAVGNSEILNTESFTFGGVTANGAVTLGGATTASSSLAVTGATALNGGLTMDGTAFAVADTTGVVTLTNGAILDNNATADTLTITEGTVAISGAETVSGTLGVTGKTTVVDFEATGTVTLPSGTVVAHLLNSSATSVTVTGTTYAAATEVLNTSTGSDDITTKGTKNFIITYSANTSVSAGEQLIITNISVESSAGVNLHTATPTNITFADSQATYMQNTIQVFVEGVVAADNMDIVVRARKTGSSTVSVQDQTLTVIAV
ncbi:MAG: hypothetical protein WAV32_02385 [Halobacteriota archaeon]